MARGGFLFQFRQTEVQQLRPRFGEHDVAGLQVAMRDTFAVGLVQRIGNLDRVLQHMLQRQRTFQQPLRERLAFEIFHHQKINFVSVSGVVERADVGMIQAGDRFCLAVEALAQFRAAGEMSGENLDGDDALEASIAGLIHFSHPARTDGGEDFIGSEFGARRERHYFFPVGTFCFSSSNQFSTTLICVGAASACSAGLSIRKRSPSGVTS